MSGVSLRLVPLAGDGPLLSFGHFPLQGELHSAALTTHCVVIHYRLDRHPLQHPDKLLRYPCRGRCPQRPERSIMFDKVKFGHLPV